jgi:hypothetical protein
MPGAGGFKLGETKIHAKGNVWTKTKTEQTKQRRTNKIRKTRWHAGGFKHAHILAIKKWMCLKFSPRKKCCLNFKQ